MNIPCKECISFAICRHREKIICDKLLASLNNSPNDFTWPELNQILPEAIALRYESVKSSKRLNKTGPYDFLAEGEWG